MSVHTEVTPIHFVVIDLLQLEDSGQFKTVVAFDCRGVEPVDFDPRASVVTPCARCCVYMCHGCFTRLGL